MKTAQNQAQSKTDVIVRGVEAHEVGEAEPELLKDWFNGRSAKYQKSKGLYIYDVKGALNSLLSLTEFDENSPASYPKLNADCAMSTPIGFLDLNILVPVLFPNSLGTDTLTFSVVIDDARVRRTPSKM